MSLFGNAMKNIIEARERQAQRYVSRVMQDMGPFDQKTNSRARGK